MSGDVKDGFQQNVKNMVAVEVGAIRELLKMIERKLDLPEGSAKLVLDMSVVGFVDRVLEIQLTSTEGKAQEKKGPVFLQ